MSNDAATDGRCRELRQKEQQLTFWRERLQVAGTSCRSGVVRERAAREIEQLELAIRTLRQQINEEHTRGEG